MPSSTNQVAVIDAAGKETVLYKPQPHQVAFHESEATNVLALGTRGTGKSTQLRWDAIIRCLTFPNFRALIVRRTMPQLRQSHLNFIEYEMRMLGGTFLHTTFVAKFPNGSSIQFSHCEKQTDIMNFLSSEYGAIFFDELSTFTLEMFLMISAAARTSTEVPYRAVVRAGTNPLGIGAQWLKSWFCTKDVNIVEYPDYHPDDFEMQFSTLEDNKYVDRKDYEKRLKNLPEQVRRAWLKGEFVVEGAYFTDFEPQKEINGKVVPWHCVNAMPTWKNSTTGKQELLTSLSWINVYRSIDWGYSPDPAVCHWHIILPNKRKITFKEQTWTRTVAADVAADIKRASVGMHIVESYCDPHMFVKTGETVYSIGEIFENNGVPLSPSQNDRELCGYAIHEMLNTLIPEEINGKMTDLPSWQILEYACPELVRTIPLLQMDPTHAGKIANGPDHWAISCGYFAMGGAPPSRDPLVSMIPRWMRPK